MLINNCSIHKIKLMLAQESISALLNTSIFLAQNIRNIYVYQPMFMYIVLKLKRIPLKFEWQVLIPSLKP